ncbi:MAG: hypothetical protein WC610_02410 [Patescibacteria group bacterium]
MLFIEIYESRHTKAELTLNILFGNLSSVPIIFRKGVFCMAVRVKIESERVTSPHPARVLVYEDDRLVAEVIAKVELKEGADGGFYHCVTLEKK